MPWSRVPQDKPMIKTKAIFPALIPTLVLFLAEIASSENFDASMSPTADPVIFAKSGDKARTRYSSIAVITDRFRPGSDGDGGREVHCLPGFCWTAKTLASRFLRVKRFATC